MQFIQVFDDRILNFIQENLRSPIMDRVIPFITSLGNGGFIWIAIAIIFIITKKYRKYGLIMIPTLIICGLIGDVTIKPLVGRERPFNITEGIELLIKAPTGFSFPSGHTMSSFAAAAIISKANNKFGILAFILAALIGFSRMYLYVHYPSDVLVGCILGIIFSSIIYKIINSKLENC
ncbi:phosphatase PAP2 family protein [Clostridium weizhouense]|uniref:Phosphatase PAP2 family protein n=1 Tax=Clostridium weizhouense TaxID=2859781 RepID=A0ABS7AS48_9CLOT|nr:phosphatase PAP2 family protein [Clostridium weizhouense]MBW6411512.1 phosphatase PAP2 family protein [Clostridium weizhouense]